MSKSQKYSGHKFYIKVRVPRIKTRLGNADLVIVNNLLYFFPEQVKERSRTEQDEDKKISRLVKDMDEFLSTVPKLVGDDISKLTTDSSTK